MTDFFELLGQPRQPWLEEDGVKAAFLDKSSTLHPDRFHNAHNAAREKAGHDYAALNAACQCLRDPRERIAHLIELVSGRKPGGIQSVPAEAMELFSKVGQICREVDLFLADRTKVSSPMLKVQYFERGLEWTDKIQALQKTLNGQREELWGRLRSLNELWNGVDTEAMAAQLSALEDIHSRLSYLNRWTAQLQERLTQLAL